MRRPLLAGLLALFASAPVLQAQPAPESFISALGDSTLDRLVSAALAANQDLAVVQARVHGARALRTDALLQFAPSGGVSLGYSRQRLASAAVPGAGGRLPSQDLWDGTLQLSWEVDLFGRLRRTANAHGALLASAEEDVREVRVLIASEVARVYFELRGAQDRLDIAQRNAENQRRTLRLTLDRLEAGRGTALDSERAQAQLSSTLAAVPELQAAVLQQAHRLAVLLGQPPAALVHEFETRTPPPVLPAVSLDDGERAVRMRPDVLSAENRLQAQRALHAAARTAYLPRLLLGAAGGYTANAFDALGNTGTPRYAVGPLLSWPVLDLGRVRSHADVARAAGVEAAAHHERVLLQAREEIATALVTYDAARTRLQHLEAAASASDRATALARLRFEEGGTDFLEVLDAERRQLEAHDRLAAGRTAAAAGLLYVYRATAGRARLQ